MTRISIHSARSAMTLLFAAATLTSVTLQAQERTTPRPEVQKMAQAIVDAVNGGNAAVDALVKDHFSAEYGKARSADERRKWFEPLRAKYGKISITQMRRTAADTFVIVAAGDKDATVNLVVTHDDKFKITGLGLEEPGGN